MALSTNGLTAQRLLQSTALCARSVCVCVCEEKSCPGCSWFVCCAFAFLPRSFHMHVIIEMGQEKCRNGLTVPAAGPASDIASIIRACIKQGREQCPNRASSCSSQQPCKRCRPHHASGRETGGVAVIDLAFAHRTHELINWQGRLLDGFKRVWTT